MDLVRGRHAPRHSFFLHKFFRLRIDCNFKLQISFWHFLTCFGRYLQVLLYWPNLPPATYLYLIKFCFKWCCFCRFLSLKIWSNLHLKEIMSSWQKSIFCVINASKSNFVWKSDWLRVFWINTRHISNCRFWGQNPDNRIFHPFRCVYPQEKWSILRNNFFAGNASDSNYQLWETVECYSELLNRPQKLLKVLLKFQISSPETISKTWFGCSLSVIDLNPYALESRRCLIYDSILYFAKKKANLQRARTNFHLGFWDYRSSF